MQNAGGGKSGELPITNQEGKPVESNTLLLVLGTRNAHKAQELQELFAPLQLEIKTLADFPQAVDVAEDAFTFAENAEKKAVEQARHLGQWVLGEDSGLVVDALGGAPGPRSARFAGPQATDEENNQKLLRELEGVPPEKRTAAYVCHMVVADPQGEVRARQEARCRGRITTTPRGTAGFGYDPLFEIIEYHRTFGELGLLVKQRLSHRARATERLLVQLRHLLLEQR